MSAPVSFELPLSTPTRLQVRAPISRLLVGLCALLIFSVLSFGAVEQWSISILEVGAALFILFWAVGQAWSGRLEIRPNPLYGPMLLFALVVGLQIALNLSSYRYDSLQSSIQYLAYAMVFFVTVQSLGAERSSKVTIWIFTVFGFALILVIAGIWVYQ